MKNFILVLFLLTQFCVKAQHPVRVEYSKMSNGDYRFECHVTDGRPHYVIVYFNEIRGLTCSALFPCLRRVRSGTNVLFTLKKTDGKCGSYFNYRYRYLDGDPRAEHDGIPYLMPVKNGASSKVFGLTYIGKYFDKDSPENWACYGFRVNPEDTVYASRRGTVIEVEKNYDLPLHSPFFTSNRNSIRVLHRDGTIARYKNFSKNGIFPEVGDRVYAGDPIGISEPENDKKNQFVSLMVYYPNAELLNLTQRQMGPSEFVNIRRTIPKNDKSYWIYVQPKFKTASGIRSLELHQTYVADHDKETIMAEMSRREKKKWLAK